MQRTVTRFNLHDIAGQQAADLAYWLAQPVQALIDAVEALRQHHLNPDPQGQAYVDIRLRECFKRLQWAPARGVDTLALATAAQTASVSFATALPPQVLAQALASGVLPRAYSAHIGTLLDEAPLPVMVAAVEAAAAQSGVPAAKLWKHIGAWARALQSPRKEWYGL